MSGSGNYFGIGVGNASETDFGVANKFFIYNDNTGNMPFVIDTNDRIGIGTPSPGTPLHVYSSNDETVFFERAGGSKLGFWNTTGDGAAMGTETEDSLCLYANAGDCSIYIAPDTGYVGIGNTGPSNPFHLTDSGNNQLAMRLQAGSGNTGGAWTGIGFSGENSNTKGGILFQSIGDSYSRGNMIFALNNAQDEFSVTSSGAVMTLTPGGNVGIGTASGQAVLNVYGAGSGGDTISIRNPNASEYTTLAVLDSTGNQVAALGYGNSSASYNPNTLILNTSSKDIVFATSLGGGDRMRILSSNGNVGIGTTPPGSALQVNGGAAIGYSASTAAPTNGLAVSGHVTVEGVTSTGATGTAKFVFSASPTFTGTLTAASLTASSTVTFSGLSGAASSSNVLCIKTNVVSYYNGTTCTNSSDARIKRFVEALPEDKGLDSIMKLRPVRFHWRDVADDKENGEQYGLIAQEVEAVFPAHGITFTGGDLTLSNKVTAVAAHVNGHDAEIAALRAANDNEAQQIQTLGAENAKLKAANDNEMAEIRALSERVKALEAAGKR